MVHGREGTEKYPVYVSPRFGSFYVLLLENNKYYVVVYKNLVNMCLSDVLTWKL